MAGTRTLYVSAGWDADRWGPPPGPAPKAEQFVWRVVEQTLVQGQGGTRLAERELFSGLTLGQAWQVMSLLAQGASRLATAPGSTPEG